MRSILVEEILNSITHGIGVLLSLLGLIILLIIAFNTHNIWKITGFSIFGISLLLVYFFSTLFHSLIFSKAKKVFLILDQSSIFLLIAGTYTPLLLLFFRNWFGWILLVIIWSISIIGIILKSINLKENGKMWVYLYLGLGWMSLIILKPLVSVLPLQSILLLFLGGMCYTLGVLFYLFKKLPFTHAIWHIFVIFGSTCHFLMLYRL